MDVVGSEIGQKMRSAIKAKLTELGCYVDDELPDYVMVMVANKRTRVQMEDDLQLFLGDNTTLFVNWLHQVLKKLQEVTVSAPIVIEQESGKEKVSKEKKSKDKKDKGKSKKVDNVKKSKKKDKEKAHRKKEAKKVHKSKKRSKHHGMIRPNIPPLLMNIEKVSEPSITDVFAGQILKSHGITLESLKDEPKIPDVKPTVQETKRPILPIIDPATITSQPDTISIDNEPTSSSQDKETTVLTADDTKQDQLNEIDEIEAKIQGLKQKLVDQLDSMSEDEDFLNIRTEAEELMNDFAEDVFQEISQQTQVETPPMRVKTPTPPPKEPPPKPVEVAKTVETLPLIELNLPKRPVRERLGIQLKKPDFREESRKSSESPERFTPEREPEKVQQTKQKPEVRKLSSPDFSAEKSESSSKRLTSSVRVSVPERPSRSCASVVRVRPRPRVATQASSLLLRAVADAHKSLLNIPTKVNTDPPKIKRALVLPMRRVGEPKIVIQVAADRHRDSQNDNASPAGDFDSEDDKSPKVTSGTEKDEFVLPSITMKVKNTEYQPSRLKDGRTASRREDSLVIESINIHNPTVHKDKNTQFIVTMDGYHPNAFLAKKLMTEGILNDEDVKLDKPKDINTSPVLKTPEPILAEETPIVDNTTVAEEKSIVKELDKPVDENPIQEKLIQAKPVQDEIVNDDNVQSEKQEIVKQEKIYPKSEKTLEKRKSDSFIEISDKIPAVKKRKASPIVFDVKKKEKVVKERERTLSTSSDSQVVVTTATSSHKYDAVPPLSIAERKVTWCRAFPMCRYGSACAFQHPRCKFAAGCTRRNCVYSHAAVLAAAPTVSSHVVPVANYKSITPAALPSMCKFYPSCVNPSCPYYHPKPCRYGAACINKLECNFYHAELPTKWRSTV